MTVEIKAKDLEQAEAMERAAYKNEEYILDVEHFAGVEFRRRERKWTHGTKIISARSLER